MKKNLLVTAVLSIVSLSAIAQPEKGNTFIGLGITNMSPAPQGLGDVTLNRKFIVPKVGYYLNKHVAIGTSLFFTGSILPDKSLSYNVGIRPFVRYYFLGNRQKENKKAFWFLEANAGMNRSAYKNFSYNYASHDNYLNYGLAAGVSYFVTPDISIEALLRVDAYQGTHNENNDNLRSSFSIQPMGEIGVNFNLRGRKKSKKE